MRSQYEPAAYSNGVVGMGHRSRGPVHLGVVRSRPVPGEAPREAPRRLGSEYAGDRQHASGSLVAWLKGAFGYRAWERSRSLENAISYARGGMVGFEQGQILMLCEAVDKIIEDEDR